MWFLPNASIHLTEENPGPIEIDFSLFSTEEQNLIKIGVNTGQITGILPEEKKQEVIITPPTEVSRDIYERDNILAGKLQILLKQRLPNIKMEIGKMNDSRILNNLLSLEENNKNRKSITDLIKLKLEEVYKNVLASIKEVDINTNVDQLDKLSRSFVDDIVDIEDKEVIVPLEE